MTMSTVTNSKDPDILNKENYRISLINNASCGNNDNYRSDIINNEKNIPNVFITPKLYRLDSGSYPLSVLEQEKDIPNIFNVKKLPADSTHTSNYIDKLLEYPNLFTMDVSYSKLCNFKRDFWGKINNYTNVFSLSDIQCIDYVQNLEVYNSDYANGENNNSIPNEKLLNKSTTVKTVNNVNTLNVNELNTSEKCSIFEEEMSSALCFWCIVTGINVRDHNIKTYFPQKEISNICIMNDIKLMLINMGTNYFVVDEETNMYKHNGNISMIGLTPEMFESATDLILECSNLYKILCSRIINWKETYDDNIIKAFIFAVSNILDDYERTIYAVSDESLLSLVGRLSHIIPQLKLIANICCVKNYEYNAVPDHAFNGIKLLNKIYTYLFHYQFSRDLFLKTLLYIFESCCLAYFRSMSNWALKGNLNNEKNMFIKLKPDIEDEDIINQRYWYHFIIDESVEVPVFLNDKFKKDILYCGKTVNFFNKFNDLNVFLPDFTCCFDAVDTQKSFDQFSSYFKYNSNLKSKNLIKKMSNCYLFESTIGPIHSNNNTDSNVIQDKITTNFQNITKSYLNDENYEFFQIPDWTSVENTYNFNKPYGFFLNYNTSLTYNGKPFDVINMIDYIPHSLLIPARIQKSVCDKQILDMFFVQNNLMGHLYYLSQCFFLMNWQFSSKLCEMLFNGIATNRQNPVNIFNSIKLSSIVDEAIHDSSLGSKLHNLTLEISFIPYLNGIIDISDLECIELNYSPKWPINMILSNKMLLKYRQIFMFANKLEYVSWSLCKAKEILSGYKNDIGLQFRKINIFKHWMIQFVSSIQQYYKQVVIGTCWAELNENFENIQNYDDLFASHKQYIHKMLRQCFMVVGFKDKLILLNKIYIEILAYYQALVRGKFYMNTSEWLHSDFIAMEESFYRFIKLREMFYSNLLKTVQTKEKHCVLQLESLITILGPL